MQFFVSSCGKSSYRSDYIKLNFFLHSCWFLLTIATDIHDYCLFIFLLIFYIFKFQMKIILWSYLALECCLNIISMECDVCCCFFHIAKIWLENACKYFQSCMSETFLKDAIWHESEQNFLDVSERKKKIKDFLIELSRVYEVFGISFLLLAKSEIEFLP